MKVSVCMITYDHEKYIAQAIEGVLMQQTDFDYELVIGEDCSTDRTRTIVLDYQCQYPDKIRALLPQRNLGLLRNFSQTLGACTGQYVALIDGDDYWTSPHKLQRQADFLDTHPDCPMCFHAAHYLYEGRERQPANTFYGGRKDVLTFEDLLISNGIPTATVMLRAASVGELPVWYDDLPMEDWPVYLFLARHGAIRYLNEAMSVYRVHPTSAWSSTSVARQARDTVTFLEKIIAHLDLNDRQRAIARTTISEHRLQIAIHHFAEGDRAAARAELDRATAVNPALFQSADLLQGAIMYVRAQYEPAANAAFIKALFTELFPRTAFLSHVQRRLRSWLYMREVFAGMQQRNPQRIDVHLWRGLRYNPTWLFNRGVLVTLLRSLYRQSKLRLHAHL